MFISELTIWQQYQTTLSVIKPYKIGQIVEHKHKLVESESEKLKERAHKRAMITIIYQGCKEYDDFRR